MSCAIQRSIVRMEKRGFSIRLQANRASRLFAYDENYSKARKYLDAIETQNSTVLARFPNLATFVLRRWKSINTPSNLYNVTDLHKGREFCIYCFWVSLNRLREFGCLFLAIGEQCENLLAVSNPSTARKPVKKQTFSFFAMFSNCPTTGTWAIIPCLISGSLSISD